MNILLWNCRGSGDTTVTTLNRYLRCTKATIAFISETRCDLDRARTRVARLPLCNFFGVPSEGRSGGLWLLWNDEVSVKVCRSSKFYIFAEVESRDGQKLRGLIAVYGDPSRLLNTKIWEEIEEFIDMCDGHACIFGEINAIAYLHEKSGGLDSLGSQNRSFKDWIRNMGLMDLGYHGPAFTWSNRQGGTANISQRLDRALSTASWIMTYHETAVFHLPRFSSDHLPILIRTKPKPIRARPSFRCENWWNLKEGFKGVCQRAALNGHANWCHLKACFRYEVKIWLGDSPTPDMMLCKVEEEMKVLNGSRQLEETIARERQVQHEHQQILIMQERYWHQRARLNWALYGDANTRFFHATAVTRNQRNSIRALRAIDG